MELTKAVVNFLQVWYGPLITWWHAINCGIIAVLISFSSLHHQDERMYKYSGILGYILAASSAWISLDIIFGGYGGYTNTADWAQILVITGIVIIVRGDLDKIIYIARRLWGYKKILGDKS